VIRVYHRTTEAAAAAIQAQGFKDATDTYMTANEYTGVWFADSPLDSNEGASAKRAAVARDPGRAIRRECAATL
jgi:hypothetical protein